MSHDEISILARELIAAIAEEKAARLRVSAARRAVLRAQIAQVNVSE